MIRVPVSTVEKPLTAIDYIAAMDACTSADEISAYAELVPAKVKHDDRFTKAVRTKLDAIKRITRAA